MTQTSFRRLAVATGVLIACFATILLLGLPSERGAVIISNVGQCLAPALAAMACLFAAGRGITRRHKLGWRLLGGSALSWSLGQVVWTYYEISGAAAPFPSAADVGFLAAVPLALAAVWMLTDRTTTSSWLVAVLDGLIIAGGAARHQLAPRHRTELGGGRRQPVPAGPHPRLPGRRSRDRLGGAAGDHAHRPRPGVGPAGDHRHRPRHPAASPTAPSCGPRSKGPSRPSRSPTSAGSAGYLVLFLAAVRYPLPVASGRSELRTAPSLRRALVPLTVVIFAWILRMAAAGAGRAAGPGPDRHHGDHRGPGARAAT